MIFIKIKDSKLNSPRSFVFLLIVISSFSVLLMRLFYLQIIREKYYRKISEENRTQVVFAQAPRGDIFDRNRKPLVTNKPAFTLTFTPALFSDSSTLQDVVSKLAKVLNLDMDRILDELNKAKLYPFQSSKIARGLLRDEAFYILERNSEFPGFNIQVEPVRDYLYNELASHIIGYLGEIDKYQLEELETEGYKRGDLIGKTGVERVYDKFIRGIDGGTCIEISAQGNQIRILNNIEPERGNDVILTIDMNLQRIAEEVFSGYKGSIIIIQPNSGEILALVSKPDFNPNVFLTSLDKKKTYYLLKSGHRPLFNRCIQAQYAPGSVFKIITAIAALEEEVITPKDKFFCNGEYTLERYNRVFKCWKKDGHGSVDIIEGIAKSCNVYFYQVGLLLGIGNLPKYAKEFGLGNLTNVDLPGEKAGIIPDRSWKKKVLKESWWEGDTLNMSIGQGYLWVTPLQIANLISTVANEGKLFQPHIVKKIVSEDGKIIKEFNPKLIRKISLKPDTWNIIKKGLRLAVTKGTGQAAYSSKLSIAGKTGTAQNPQGNDHAWFAGFGPVDKPEFAFVVFVEHGGHGGVVAAPIAKKILERYYGLEEEHRDINTVELID